MSKNIERRCRMCGCTDYDCRQCIKKTGAPCYWVDIDLCSACVEQSPNNGFIVLDAVFRIERKNNTYQVCFENDLMNKFSWIVSVYLTRRSKNRRLKIAGYKTYGAPSDINALTFLNEALVEQQSPSSGA